MRFNASGVYLVFWALWRVQGQNPPETPAICAQGLKKADSGLFYISQVLQNKQIATSRNNAKDLRLVEKTCYRKNGLTYLNKTIKTIILCIYLF